MDHSEIGDDIKIGGGSVVSGKLTEPGIYSSSLKVDKLNIWQKNAVWIRKLDALARRLQKLEKK
jgi:UDP-3-O-[3-hydroxymyristoyl] glucosamine N-acyltransferase